MHLEKIRRCLTLAPYIENEKGARGEGGLVVNCNTLVRYRNCKVKLETNIIRRFITLSPNIGDETGARGEDGLVVNFKTLVRYHNCKVK